MTPDLAERRTRALTAIVVAVAGALATWSGVDLWTRASRPADFAGARALSTTWAAPPARSGDWIVSRDVPPPPEHATRAELGAWLKLHYPVLTLGQPPPADASATPVLDLGGGPPRGLFVLPGRGLVMKEP